MLRGVTGIFIALYNDLIHGLDKIKKQCIV